MSVCNAVAEGLRVNLTSSNQHNQPLGFFFFFFLLIENHRITIMDLFDTVNVYLIMMTSAFENSENVKIK